MTPRMEIYNPGSYAHVDLVLGSSRNPVANR